VVAYDTFSGSGSTSATTYNTRTLGALSNGAVL
jgi:hypothetical protein